MSTLQSLPAVAQRYHTDCKKCGAERYHIVLAHTTSTSAKLECEVCHSKRTLKLDKPKKRTAGAVKVSKSVPKTNRWDDVKGLLNEGAKQPYNMRVGFALNATIDHPKFGLGVVTASAAQSIEVVFADGTRSLVHNRP